MRPKHRTLRRRYRRRIPFAFAREEAADERAQIRMRRLEVAAYTATINLITAQRASANRSIRRSLARIKRLAKS